MDLDGTGKEISRRKMLKRIGAGAAIAWTAPVLTSLRTPAFGQRYNVCEEPCNATCGNFPRCGSNPETGEACFCSRDRRGLCFCWNNAACAALPNCGNLGCPPGWSCTSTCCDQSFGTRVKCLPPCGTSAGAGSGGGPSAAG
jgi:hypothetical protein